jgi:uncharacterized membrane-anchored protein YjiN (DUF445 family)
MAAQGSIAPESMIDPLTEQKHARLREMQRIATALLLAMLAVLVLTEVLEGRHPAVAWVQAFAAAATVGAIADWFAVVALFHHPLRLPLPHTAIVPRNKDRIGESLGRFVEQNFLTAENVLRKLGQRNLSLEAARWLAREENAADVASRLCAFVPGMLNAFGDEDVKRLFDRAIASQLRKIDLAHTASAVAATLTAGGRHQALLDRALIALEQWLVAHQAEITRKFGEASKYTPRVFDRFVVAKFVAGIIALLHEVARNPGHAIRLEFDAATERFIARLATEAEYRAHAEAFKQALLDHLEQEKYYQAVWDDLRSRLKADVVAEDSRIRAHLCEILRKLGVGLAEDAGLQSKLNAWIMQTVETTVVRHRHQVSALITEVVRGWDPGEVSEKMELEIGRDLQYIRINGTLVGGAVGLVIHGLTAMF